AQHKQGMARAFGHTQWLAMNGQDPPVPTNTVDLDPRVTDAHGFPGARVSYSHHPNDYTAGSYAISKLRAILSEMGAESSQTVLPFVATTSIPQPAGGGLLARGQGRSAPDPIGGL